MLITAFRMNSNNFSDALHLAWLCEIKKLMVENSIKKNCPKDCPNFEMEATFSYIAELEKARV